MRTCPACDSSEYTTMGTLGSREHYRCRRCGIDFSAPKPNGWQTIKTVNLSPEEMAFLFPDAPECDDPECEDCG